MNFILRVKSAGKKPWKSQYLYWLQVILRLKLHKLWQTCCHGGWRSHASCKERFIEARLQFGTVGWPLLLTKNARLLMQRCKLWETSDQKAPRQLEGMTARKSIAGLCTFRITVFHASVVLTGERTWISFCVSSLQGKNHRKVSISTIYWLQVILRLKLHKLWQTCCHGGWRSHASCKERFIEARLQFGTVGWPLLLTKNARLLMQRCKLWETSDQKTPGDN